MSQATLSERPYVNSNLFSGHYLDERVQGRDEWDCDEAAREAMDDLQSLYELEGPLVEGYGEDALIDNWIDEVLDVLGFGTQQEVTLPDGGGFVDELLFEDTATRRDAAGVFLRTEDTTDLFENGIGIVEAKQWDADFTVQFSEQRPYRNASHQTKHYLENTPPNIQWGVLTNGRKWRLYGTNDYETQTYYEVDLPELLRQGDLEAFKYFYVFFRPSAFHESGGTTFLDEVWSESETASQELGENLQDNVFTALRVLGRGFVETNDGLNIDPDDEEALAELKEQSLVLLYRLMFVLYAEARGLIHPENQSAQDDYEENFSLDALRLEIHEEIGEVDAGFEDEFSDYSTGMWSRLEDLFRLIDQGEDDLGIPPYNGGLFDHEEHSFLAEHEVSNRYLAEVIYRLSTTQNDEGRYVLADYADLDTRHLGSVYEGLLEHQFRIASEQYAAVAEDGGQVWKPATEVSVSEAVETVPEGGLYVVNDEGERKATGAYYTPDYVVTYIVEETVGPLVEEIREDLIDQGFEPGTEEYIGPFFRRVTDLRILDPAMGSGHFLTKATGYLSEQVMSEVREAETEFGVAFDEQHIRREIAKECIYGVDLNGMAVELAKLSMWLETLAADRPLAFLDHHFKQGNSLVGSDIEDIEELESDANGDNDQYSLAEFGATREGTIERLMDIYSEFLAIENETVEDVREMKRKYTEIEQDELRRRLLAMANVHTSEQFDLDVPSGAYERMAKALDEDALWKAVEDTDWFTAAQKIAQAHSFFHWRFAFPEVYYLDNGEELQNPGFDAVVGNPPYISMDKVDDTQSEYLRVKYPEVQKGQADYLFFFMITGAENLKRGGRLGNIVARYYMKSHFATGFRNWLQNSVSINSIVDFENYPVFDIGTRTCITILSKPDDTDAPKSRVDYYRHSKGNTERSESLFVELDEQFNQIQIKQPQLHSERWIFPTQSERGLMNKVDSAGWSLKDKCVIGQGMQTGANSVFEVNEETIDEYQIEEEALKKVISNENISRYTINFDERYWVYIPKGEEQVKDEYPNAINYLQSHKEELEDRIAIRRGDCRWYEFSYPRHSDKYDRQKLITPYIAPRNTFGIDKNGDIYSSTDTHVIFPTERTNVSLKYIAAILNSKLMTWRHIYLGKKKDYRYEYFNNALERYSIKNVDFEFSDDERKNKANDILSKRNGYLQDEEQYSMLVTRIQELIERNQTGILHELVIQTCDQIILYKNQYDSLNLNLLDFIQPYSGGSTLREIGTYQPPKGVGDTKLTATKEDHGNLRVGRVTCERENKNTLVIHATARYKPDDKDAHETDQWGYTETEPMPAMRLTDLSEAEADLVESFVPVAVEKADGFAGFRETATKTNSLVDRLEAITLPDPDEVADDLERYRDTVERAAELDEKIQRTDDLIDEIVYDLYGLTDEEIEIVEDAVAGD